jgi:two-component system, NtrC family, response regulator AtoC
MSGDDFGDIETLKQGTREAKKRTSDERGARLLIVGAGSSSTIPLPRSGEIVIGRGRECEARIEDPAISRQHARLHLGERIELEDLGSANGTLVRNVLLGANQKIEVLPGDTVEIGPYTLIIQHPSGSAERLRRVWPHGYFEARLEDECTRADRYASILAVGRVHAGEEIARERIHEIIAGELRPEEVAARYGPGEFEFLLIDTSEEIAEAVADRILGAVRALGAKDARIGMALYPKDGRTPEVLIGRACEMVRGVRAQQAEGKAKRAASGASEDGWAGFVGPGPEVIVESPAMKSLHHLIERVAQGSISVLILGETGVGKEITAELIHKSSPRKDRPFVRLNCAALSETLIESELFGHEKGAFTGALRTKPGLLETAQGGTIFLDEVGELPMSTQVKLLRVLEERKVLRVGALEPTPIDVRIVSATNRDLEEEIDAGTFRRDLYFRLDGIAITVPPLRERTEEIPSMASLFVRQICRQDGRTRIPEVSKEAMRHLLAYGWPGNIRELKNVIERAVLLSEGGAIEPTHLPLEKMSADSVAPPKAEASTSTRLADDMQEFERQRIIEALDKCGGNQTKAAQLLGIARRTLIKRLDLYAIDRPRKGRP